MHSDGRGSSSSSKPVTKNNPDWVDYSEEEINELVVKLRRDGLEPSQIGLKLRDEYGIPSVREATGKKVTEILKEEGLELNTPEDLKNLLEKAESIQEHLSENKKDENARRRLELTEAKIRKLGNYYKDKGKLSEDWKYVRKDKE